MLLEKVELLYKEIDRLIVESQELAGVCEACAKCCDFDTFGHKLFVSTPEMIFFANRIGAGNIKKMETGVCPYNIEGRCTVYDYRFLGCRIFSCKGSEDFQSKLTEFSLGKIKTMCKEMNIPYCYTDLASALNNYNEGDFFSF